MSETTTSTTADYLKYAVAILRAREEWVTDSIGGSACDHESGHEIELDAIHDVVTEIRAMAIDLFGNDLMVYSDGRAVEQYAQIEDGVVTHHVWHPDPAAEEPRSWRGALRHDPGEPSPGIYEVSTDPATQSIHVRAVRIA
ncbi:hypothetical protein ACN27E_07870 [Mycobacterium sp. WMMD1722]|uniref:hypothetical protein n=1 Tax=Mycobacterium sp. WMMD1722 TaxID=3404117 RepID=UPI003BF57A14